MTGLPVLGGSMGDAAYFSALFESVRVILYAINATKQNYDDRQRLMQGLKSCFVHLRKLRQFSFKLRRKIEKFSHKSGSVTQLNEPTCRLRRQRLNENSTSTNLK